MRHTPTPRTLAAVLTILATASAVAIGAAQRRLPIQPSRQAPPPVTVLDVTKIENCTLSRLSSPPNAQVLEGVCFGHRFATHPLAPPPSCLYQDAGRGFYVVNCMVDGAYIEGRMALQKPTAAAVSAFKASLEPIPIEIGVTVPGYTVRAEMLGRVQFLPGAAVHSFTSRRLRPTDILAVACPLPEYGKPTSVEIARVANQVGTLKCFVESPDDAHTTAIMGVTCESGGLPLIDEDAGGKPYMSGPPVTVFACDPAYPRSAGYRAKLVEQSMPIRRETNALALKRAQQQRDRDNLLFFGLAAMLLNGSSNGNSAASCAAKCQQDCSGASFLSAQPRNAGEQAVCTIACQGFC